MRHILRQALRALAGRPSFAVLCALSLAVAIGANTAVFSIVNALIIRELPLREPAGLVAIEEHPAGDPAGAGPVSQASFAGMAAAAGEAIDLAAEHRASMAVSDGGPADRHAGARISPGFFAVFGVRAARGRTLTPGDHAPAAAPVAVLSHALWTERYARDPSVLGRAIVVNGTAHTVVGIMPESLSHLALRGLLGVRLWLPLPEGQMTDPGDNRRLRVYGRLRSGVTRQAAQDRLDAAVRADPGSRDLRIVVQPLRVGFSAGTHAMLVLIMGAVNVVLLIACANVANLTLARTAGRRHELATRLALGATRSRLLLHLVVESLLIAVVSAPAGALLGAWGRVLLLGHDASPDLYAATSIDGSVLLFSIGMALAATVLSGLLPAMHALRRLPLDVLRTGGRAEAGLGPRHSRLMRVLIAAEVALAVVLLVSAAVFFKSYRVTLAAPGGFDTVPVLTMSVDVAPGGDSADEHASRAVFAVTDRLAALPGASHVAAANLMPLRDAGTRATIFSDAPGSATGVAIAIGAVTPEFFDVLGVPLLRGRMFTGAEARSAAAVAVVNRRLADRAWPGQDPVGRRFQSAANGMWFTVIGVSESILNWDISDRPVPTAYVPYPHGAVRDPHVFIRATGDPLLLAAAARSAVAETLPLAAFENVRTMTEVHRAGLSRHQTLGRLFGALAAIALVLGASGVYSVLAWFVAQRTFEIGIRAALGADRRSLVRMVVSQGMAVASIGVAVGLPAAWAVSRVLRQRIYNVSPPDPLILAGAATVLLAIAWCAAFVPARRAASVDPLAALRQL